MTLNQSSLTLRATTNRSRLFPIEEVRQSILGTWAIWNKDPPFHRPTNLLSLLRARPTNSIKSGESYFCVHWCLIYPLVTLYHLPLYVHLGFTTLVEQKDWRCPLAYKQHQFWTHSSSKMSSQGVSNPSSVLTQCCLTSVSEWGLVFPTWHNSWW